MNKDELVGKQVEIVVDRAESGDQGRFNVFHGTICGEVRDRNGVLYHVVRSHEESEQSESATTVHLGPPPTEHFLVAPRFEGDTLWGEFRKGSAEVLIGIARVVDVSILGRDSFDFSQVNYFAVGALRFVNLH